MYSRGRPCDLCWCHIAGRRYSLGITSCQKHKVRKKARWFEFDICEVAQVQLRCFGKADHSLESWPMDSWLRKLRSPVHVERQAVDQLGVYSWILRPNIAMIPLYKPFQIQLDFSGLTVNWSQHCSWKLNLSSISALHGFDTIPEWGDSQPPIFSFYTPHQCTCTTTCGFEVSHADIPKDLSDTFIIYRPSELNRADSGTDKLYSSPLMNASTGRLSLMKLHCSARRNKAHAILLHPALQLLAFTADSGLVSTRSS